MSDNLEKLAENLAAEAGEGQGAGGGDGGAGNAGDGGAGSGGTGSGGAPSGDASAEADRNLKLIMDIPLRVSVELGRTKMPVSELLNLGQGSVIELSKLAGEPMEVLVNDKLIARGEAVVVNEKFGVRLTDIISTKERVEQLR